MYPARSAVPSASAPAAGRAHSARPAAVIGWRYAFLALAAGPMTALPALTVLIHQIRPNDLLSATTERTSP